MYFSHSERSVIKAVKNGANTFAEISESCALADHVLFNTLQSLIIRGSLRSDGRGYILSQKFETSKYSIRLLDIRASHAWDNFFHVNLEDKRFFPEIVTLDNLLKVLAEFISERNGSLDKYAHTDEGNFEFLFKTHDLTIHASLESADGEISDSDMQKINSYFSKLTK